MKYHELSEEGKARARDQWRDSMTCFDWYDCTFNDAKEQLAEKGIKVDDIYFSGFWSQGDGACFAGRIDDLQKFIDSHFKPEDMPAIRSMIKLELDDFYLDFSCRHTGHYSHEYSVSFSYDYSEAPELPFDPEEDPLRHAAYIAIHKLTNLEKELQDFEEQATEIFRNHMRQLYKDLEAEYEYLTSDEAVVESIEAEYEYLTSDEAVVESIEANYPDFDDEGEEEEERKAA